MDPRPGGTRARGPRGPDAPPALHRSAQPRPRGNPVLHRPAHHVRRDRRGPRMSPLDPQEGAVNPVTEVGRMAPKEYDGILLASFGGPEGQDDVIPFLRNVTRGRGIPDERLEEVSHHYRANGGISPINQQNRDLKAGIEGELERRGVDLPVYWGNRNWGPMLADALQEAA